MIDDFMTLIMKSISGSKVKKNKLSDKEAEYIKIQDEIKKFSKSKLNRCLKDAEKIAVKVGKFSLKYFIHPFFLLRICPFAFL